MPRARRFDWNNLGLRIVSAAVLAPAALAIAWYGGALFLIMMAVVVALLSYEWAHMVAPTAAARVAVVMALATVGVVLTTYSRGAADGSAHVAAAAGVIGLGMVAAAVFSRGATQRRADAAYGVLYVGPAALAIVWLRDTMQGDGWTVMLLAVTWAADICAYVAGNALKGPKLWPRFSPNKTWSGFFGGLLGAAAAAVGVAALLMRPDPAAGRVGLSLAGLATMMGDLWESMLKRRFGVKDSGDLIPGHGGLLDRVDGLMFATIVFAAARLIVRFGWAH
jgi:phosphatidate cytidylyltransferase